MYNVRQLSMAVTNFETGKKKFPGIQSSFTVQQDRGKLGPWVVSLLPLIEEQALKDLWDSPNLQEQWEQEWLSNPANDSKFYPQLPKLLCPRSIDIDSEPSLTSYFANAGFYLLRNDPVLGLPIYKACGDTAFSYGLPISIGLAYYVSAIGY
jgi:Protein of unknown function (DUF1559)